MSVMQFILAALELSGWRCKDCNEKLVLVWIGDEHNPVTQYVECPKCNAEYALCVAFMKEVPPEEQNHTLDDCA